MSYTIADTAILAANTGLTASSKLVLIVLAQHADTSGVCWPGIQRIAELSCLCERAVRNSLRKLEDLGLLRCQHRLGASTRYRIMLDSKASPSPSPASASRVEQAFAPLEPSDYLPLAPVVPPAAPVAPPPAPVAPLPRQMVPPNRSLETLQEIHCAPPPPLPAPAQPSRPAPAPAAPLCVPEELKTIEPQALQDFAIVRKAKKKAPMPTRTEAQDLAEQAERAGLTVAQAVRLCIIRGWARFEAAWIHDKHSAQVAAEAVPPKPVQVWRPEPVNAVPPPPEIRQKLAELRAKMVSNIQGKMLDTGACA